MAKKGLTKTIEREKYAEPIERELLKDRLCGVFTEILYQLPYSQNASDSDSDRDVSGVSNAD